MRRTCTAFALLALTFAAVAQQPARLTDGQTVTMRGTLRMRPAGRLQYVVVQTSEAYVPVVRGQDLQPAREIGLRGYGRYDVLYAHRGQQVTVSGSVSTDDASPYYLHNVAIAVTSVRLANGTELRADAVPRRPIAADVGQYQASVQLPADLAAPWRYSARGQADPDRQFLSCGSNGGGDVVNCYCAKGFHATKAQQAIAGRVDDARLMDFAQFDVGDDARSVELSVTCSR
jgi:hypothetical protein